MKDKTKAPVGKNGRIRRNGKDEEKGNSMERREREVKGLNKVRTKGQEEKERTKERKEGNRTRGQRMLEASAYYDDGT